MIDLYCGTGTIGILCAKKAKKVYGIEIVDDAVKDARINANQKIICNLKKILENDAIAYYNSVERSDSS